MYIFRAARFSNITFATSVLLRVSIYHLVCSVSSTNESAPDTTRNTTVVIYTIFCTRNRWVRLPPYLPAIKPSKNTERLYS